MRPSLLLVAAALLGVSLCAALAGGRDEDPPVVTVERDALGPASGPTLVSSPRAPATVPEMPAGTAAAASTRSVHTTPAGSIPKRRDDPVLRGLRWLAAHQAPDGSWAPEADSRACGADARPAGAEVPLLGPDEPGLAQHRVGATACALLAFLGAGFTNRGDHEFAGVVRRARAWLVAHQQQGLVRTTTHRTWAWDHALATWALVTGYGLTEGTLWGRPAGEALEALVRLRGPDVWRYGVARGLADESLTLWARLPLLAAKVTIEEAARRERPAPWSLDRHALDAGLAWLERVTGTLDPPRDLPLPARGDADLPGTTPATFFALGLLARAHACQDLREERFAACRAWLAAGPPPWDPERRDAEVLHWWAGTHAAFVCQREPWKAWDAALSSTLLAGQVVDGPPCDLAGSWAPSGDLGRLGGRVLVTALGVMCFELYYRYDTRMVPCR